MNPDIGRQIQICLEAIKAVFVLIGFLKDNSLRDELRMKVERMKMDLENQNMMFEKKDFEVAVIGQEKAGKSSLLNAWLKFNLLPSDRNRCTYTIVEIRSCRDETEQNYYVEYFTKDEFEKKLDEIRKKYENEKGETANFVLNELSDIEKNKIEIYRRLDSGRYEKKFRAFEEVQRELVSAIAEPGHARAVKKICITTPRLSREENVVFYDMPGYNSPITLHKDQTREKLAHVDVILMAKEFEKPDLVDSECQILQISNELNEYITTSEKVIVALTCFDKSKSPKDFSELLGKSQNAWRAYGIGQEKLVPVCALAEFAEDKNELDAHREKIRRLGRSSSGLEQLKKVVNKFVVDFRERIATKRCIASKNSLIDFWRNNLCPSIERDYDVTSKMEMSMMDERELKKEFDKWWIEKWNNIDNDFQCFYLDKIQFKEDVDSQSILTEKDLEFKKAYEEIVEDSFKRMNTLLETTQSKIYKGQLSYEGIVSPAEGNTAIRKQLHQEAIQMLDGLTDRLSDILWDSFNEIIKWINEKLWELPEIRKIMIGPDENAEKEKMKKCFDSLLKRLARPAINIFLRFPRSRTNRLKVLNQFQIELEILDKFIDNGHISKRGLFNFVANGTYEPFDLRYYQIQADFSQAIPNNHNRTESHSDDEIMEEKPDEISGDLKGFIKASSDVVSAASAVFPTSLTTVASGLLKTADTILDAKDKLDTVIDHMGLTTTRTTPAQPSKHSSHSQFDDLEFAREADDFYSIHKEIQDDAREYLQVLKNSLFYGSGILRFFKQELDQMRNKFSHLENSQRVWTRLVEDYYNRKDPRISSAPDMVALYKKKAEILSEIRKIEGSINQLYLVDQHNRDLDMDRELAYEKVNSDHENAS